MAGIRRAALQDEVALRAFFDTAWGEAGPGALGWTGASDEAIREIASHPFLAALLSDPYRGVFVAEEGGGVVGIAVTRKLDASTVELAGIIVRETRTGRGIGASLLETVRRDAIAAGFSEMLVKTEALNDRALAFYQKHGFVLVEVRSEDVRETPVNLAVLRLNLPGDCSSA